MMHLVLQIHHYHGQLSKDGLIMLKVLFLNLYLFFEKQT